MANSKRQFRFVKEHKSLTEVLMDHELASLGDSYINFVYSLTLSAKTGKPSGAKVKGDVLAEAVRTAKLRDFLPSRMSRHALADAAEALVVYAWLQRRMSVEESAAMIAGGKDTAEGMVKLLSAAMKRTTFP